MLIKLIEVAPEKKGKCLELKQNMSGFFFFHDNLHTAVVTPSSIIYGGFF